jgi:hypothetical protein
VYFDLAVDPLVVEPIDETDEPDRPISQRIGVELAFTYAFKRRFEVGLLVPLHQQSGDEPMFSGVFPADGMALGDIAAIGRAFLFRSAAFSLGGSLAVTAPTGKNDAFAGVNGPTVHVRGIAALDVGAVGVAANGGFRFRSADELGDAHQGNELSYGLGAAYRVNRKLSALAELFGAIGLDSAESAGVTPLEASAGVRYRVNRDVGVVVGGGRGLLPGIGSPSARAFVFVSYAPGARAGAPVGLGGGVIEVGEGKLDVADDDMDAIINSSDRCPRLARTRTAAPRPTTTRTGCSTTPTAARSRPRTRTASRTRTAAPTSTTTATRWPTSTTAAPTCPRTPTGSRTATAATTPTTIATASPT